MLTRNRDYPGSGLFCWGMTFLLTETVHASCASRKIEISAFSQIGKLPCAHGARAGRSKNQHFSRLASRRVRLAREPKDRNISIFADWQAAVCGWRASRKVKVPACSRGYQMPSCLMRKGKEHSCLFSCRMCSCGKTELTPEGLFACTAECGRRGKNRCFGE